MSDFMDIENIEKFLSGVYGLLKQQEAELPSASLFPFVQCQMLLHIYKKLESIDDSLVTIASNQDDDTLHLYPSGKEKP